MGRFDIGRGDTARIATEEDCRMFERGVTVGEVVRGTHGLRKLR